MLFVFNDERAAYKATDQDEKKRVMKLPSISEVGGSHGIDKTGDRVEPYCGAGCSIRRFDNGIDT